MAITVKALGLSVVIVFMLLKPSQSQNCRRTEQQNYGCPFQQLSSNQRWCEAARYNNPLFAFYIKPGNDFNELKVRITKTDGFIGILDLGSHDFTVNKNNLSNADEWYHIQFQSAKAGWLNDKMSYTLFINGHEFWHIELLLSRGSKFILLINGSPFYKPDGSCNPGDNHYRPPPPTNPPPRPPPMSVAPPPQPEATTKTNIATPGNDLSTTEKSSIQPSFMRTSKNSTDSDTLRIFGEPWWVFVIIGVVIMIIIIIAVIITAIVKCKTQPWPALSPPSHPPPQQSPESDDPATHTYNDLLDLQPRGPPPPPPLDICDLDDPANHIYEEPLDDPADHIYEDPEDINVQGNIYDTVDDLGGPIIFVGGNLGRAAAYHVATPERCNIPNQPNNA